MSFLVGSVLGNWVGVKCISVVVYLLVTVVFMVN